IFLFALMVGAEPPVIRAALMGGLVMLGKFFGRPAAALKILALSAVLMLFINPLMVNDLGFQLSFLATFGLLVVEPEFSSRFKFKIWGLEDSLWSTVAAQIMVLPVLGYHFERISVGAPLPNVLILWLIPPIMFFGSLLVGASLLVAPLVPFVSAILWVLLSYFVTVIEIFSKLPGLTINLTVSLLGVVTYYLVLLAAVRKLGAVKTSK
ncbi:ComEC/Rec2 family competence protein, partial [Candidatus Parcubacteria bacterium]|nr:ComEC/Rec2 family competence protein [Candidatus Parcubacteria bacterium]